MKKMWITGGSAVVLAFLILAAGLEPATAPELPVILITAFGKIEDAVEAMRAGAFDYISKPGGPSSWTRWARCRSPSSRNCSGSSRTGSSSGWGA